MCVGRKPHPFDNVRHTISCELTSILFRALIVEGKYRPKELEKKYSELGRTVGLKLWMCKTLYGTGKAVVMDSGFCVSRHIVELERKGVFGKYLISDDIQILTYVFNFLFGDIIRYSRCSTICSS